MSILTYALQVFRYFNTNNVPSSGNHEPVKSEIQALFGLIDSSYSDLAIAITAAGENVIVVPVLNNVSDLSLSYPAGTLAFAMSGNAAGIYLKSGGSGSGSWTLTNLSLTSQLVAALQSSIAAEEAARIAADNALRDAIDDERSDRIQAVSAEEQSRKDADTDIIIQSPNEEHAGDAPLYFTNNLTGGDPADVARNLPGPVVSNADGHSVRITGSGTLSVRTLYPVEAGRTYVVRYAVRRIANSPDPANDSVRCALAWYNQDRSAIGGTPISVVQDLNDLTTGSGRVVVTAYVSMAAGDEINVVAPANTRYVRPFVETFGTTCQTDIEVISLSDVTDAVIYSPDVSDLVSRVGALESIDAGPRLDVIEAELNSPGVLGFRTVFDVAAYDVPVSVTAIVVSGYYAPGDGGSAFYKRSSGEPSHGGKAQSADGTWWEITGSDLNVRAFGAKGDNTNPDSDAFQAGFDYLNTLGGGTIGAGSGTYRMAATLKMGSNMNLILSSDAIMMKDHTGGWITNGLGYTTSSVIDAYGGNGNVGIEGGVWEGFKDYEHFDSYTGFAIGFATHIRLRNMIVKDGIGGGHPVDISACDDVHIDNCEFLGYAQNETSNERGECVQLDHNIEGSFPYFGEPTFRQNKRIKVTNCYFGANPDNVDDRFTTFYTAVGSHGSVYGQWPFDIQVLNNTMEGMYYAGVRVWKWQKVKISGNTFNNCRRPVHFTATAAGSISSQDIDRVQQDQAEASEDVEVSNNFLYNSLDFHIFTGGITFGTDTDIRHSNIRVFGNTADTATNDFFTIRNCRDVTVFGNTSKDHRLFAVLSTSASENIKIGMNVVPSAFGSAGSNGQINISASGCKNVDVFENDFQNIAAGRGLHISGGALYGKVRANRFEGVDGAAIYLQSASSYWLIEGNQFVTTNLTADQTNPSPIQATTTCEGIVAIDNQNYASNTTATIPVYIQGSVGCRARFSYTATPASVVTAPVGSECLNLAGGSGTTLYVKESGNNANTGWVAK